MSESRWSARRQRFRQLLSGPAVYHPASVFDPLSARIAEETGFECAMLAGSVASLAVLGAPDMILLTLSEFAGLAQRINRATELPLLVDADHGYGNALNVMRTVEELETAGVAGLSIEDTALPQPWGNAPPSLVPLAEGVGKLRAALAARRDASLVIAGRTHARLAALDEVVERAAAYQDTGVDAIFVVGVRTAAELEALSAAVHCPLILGNPGAELLQDREHLVQQGVRICLQGHQSTMAAIQAVRDTLQALRDGRTPAALAAPEDLRRYSRAAQYEDWQRDFLAPE